MRPVYCTQSDNARELRRVQKFVAFLSRAWPQHAITFKMSEPFANYDATIFRDGKPLIVVEVRDRFGNPDRHEHWHTAKLKIQRSLDAAAQLKLPLILLYSWNEETFYTKGENLIGLPTHMSGRRDRNDEKDWEEMLLMPPNIFKRY